MQSVASESVALPGAVPRKEDITGPSGALEADPGTNRRRLLLVEGQSLLREALVVALSQQGYEVRAVADAPEALRAVKARRPDLLVADWQLPGSGAAQLMACLRGAPDLASIPVLVLSDSAAKRDVLAAVGHGARDYILKGSAPLAKLLARVAQHASPAPAKAVPASPPGVPPASVSAPAPTTEPSPAGLPPHAEAVQRLRQLKPRLSRSELEESLGACEQVKALSPAVAQVIKLTTNARCPTDTIARAIGADPGLALKILKLANSAVYTRGAPVDSVLKAVVRIGTERIREAVLNISVIERFTDAPFGAELSPNQFWEHSIAVGLLSAELAHADEEKHAAFTTGLLHDIGRVVLAEQLGERYREVLRTARELGLPLEAVEARLLLGTHADAAERIFRSWSLGRELAAPVIHHHRSAESIRSDAAGHVKETARLALADRLAHALMLGDSGNDTLYPLEPLLGLVGIQASHLDVVTASAVQKCDDVKFAMLSSVNAAAWQHHREAVRERLGRPLVPLIVSGRPEADPVRLFCEALAGERDGPPAVAVVHMHSPRERQALSAALAAEEKALGLEPLPAIVVSPNGSTGLEEAEMARRRTVLLPMPLPVPRLLEAIRSVDA
jgi:HD-like signal output (HDOD) protein/CheY-like chemotaxis protein